MATTNCCSEGFVSGGTSTGVQSGQQFFVRRPFAAPNYANRIRLRHPIHTAGWVRIVATNDGTSIALVEHACGAINSGDYLEPFVMPDAAWTAERFGTGAWGSPVHGKRWLAERRLIVRPAVYEVLQPLKIRGLRWSPVRVI